jgi:hypothetical protein
LWEKLAQHAGVNGHVVDALLGLLLDHFKHHVDVQVFGPAHSGDRLINGHGADGHRGGIDDGFANHRDVAAGGEVHHGVGAIVNRAMKLFELVIDVRGGGGISDIRVDLAAERYADAHGLEVVMVDVGGDDGAAARHFVAHKLWRNLLTRCDVEHLFGDDALARIVHLRKIAHAAVHRRGPLFNPGFSDPHKHLRPSKRIHCEPDHYRTRSLNRQLGADHLTCKEERRDIPRRFALSG